MGILVTGFSYYGRYMFNPSEEVVRAIDGSTIGGLRVRGVVLPVSLRRAIDLLEKVLYERDYRMVLATGLNPRISKLIVELATVNVAHFEGLDEDKRRATLMYLDRSEVEALATRLPVERIYSRCVERLNLPITFSVAIGTYLCNAAGYMVTRYAKMRRIPGGFVHLPPHTDLAMRLGLGNYRSLREIIEAIRCIIEVSLEQRKNNAED